MIRELRQLLAAAFVTLASLALLLGGFSLAFAEGGLLPVATVPPPADSPTLTPAPATATLPPEAPTALPLPTDTPVPTATVVPPTNCPPPAGWVAYAVRSGDTLAGLAARYNLRAEDLARANCLVSDGLLPGTYLYVPPLPTATRVPCGPPAGWVQNYTIKENDNLYRIGLAYRVSAEQLQNANCIPDINRIYPGQRLWVPNVATSTPNVTATFTPTASATPLPSPTATNTVVPTPTATTEPTASPVTPATTTTP